jgi:hypothetical protein
MTTVNHTLSITTRRLLSLVGAIIAATFMHMATVSAAPISSTTIVNNWPRFPDPLGHISQDSWVDGGTFVDYTTNDGQTIASDSVVSGDFTFSSRITELYDEQNARDDDDRYGLVFGFQNANNNYRFSWEGGGRAEADLSRGLSLIREVSGTSVSLFNLSTTFWNLDVEYDVTVGRSGNSIT